MIHTHIFEDAKVLSEYLLEEEEKYIAQVKKHPLYFPDHEFVNDQDSDKFIMTPVGKNRFSLKPNLSNRGFLFRGETEFHSPSVASYYRIKNEGKRFCCNAKRDEFNMLYYSHPLVQMLRFGVKPEKKTLRFAIGQYGTAQHYLYETSLIDFTSWLTVAIFFATNATTDGIHYKPYAGNQDLGYLYVYKIHPGVTFKDSEIVTIGLQPFPRSGIQRGFALQSNLNTDITKHPNIDIYMFRHDRTQSQIANSFFKGGERLFPNDDLSTMSELIRTKYKNEISRDAFDFHKKFNPHCQEEYLLKMFGNELKVVDKPAILFNQLNLTTYYHINDKHWGDFCSHIYNPYTDDNDRFIDSMIELKNIDEYKEFFYPEYYDEERMQKRLNKQIEVQTSNNTSLLDNLSL